MVRNIRHTGLVVRDLERSLDFYCTVFGFEVASRATESGPFIETLVGLPGAVLEWAKLKAPDGSLLELLQYHSHPADDPPAPARSDRPGCSHAAFTVTDAQAVVRALEGWGLAPVGRPQASPDGKVVVFYCHDPEGILLEIVEETRRFPAPADLDAIVYDFDGVLTDNRVLVRQDGLESVSCNRADGLGVGLIKRLGVPQIVLSTEANPVVAARAAKLGLPVVQDCKDKAAAVAKLCAERGWDPARVLFVGNDLNDLDAMRAVGYSLAPADAHPRVLREASFVTRAPGGAGVARELAGLLSGPDAQG